MKNQKKLTSSQFYAQYKEALKKGIIKRGQCEKCGTSLRIHGHHTDYTEPLKVVWLCLKHHAEVHKNRDISNPLEKKYKAAWIDESIMLMVKQRLATKGKVKSISEFVEEAILTKLNEKKHLSKM